MLLLSRSVPDLASIANGLQSDPQKQRAHLVHNNDLENVPLTLILHLALVVAQPAAGVARLFFYTYTVARCLHTFW